MALAPAGVQMVVLVVVVVAHRLVSTAREVLQVSADSSLLCNISCFFFVSRLSIFDFFSASRDRSLGRAASQLLLQDGPARCNLPPVNPCPSFTLCAIYLYHLTTKTLHTYCPRPRDFDTLCDLGLQCLAEFFALTLNWLLADSISSAYRHITRALQILPPGCMSSGRRMPLQPRPGRIGRECLQVLCKGWTTSFLSHHFNSEREFPLEDGE